MEQCVLITGRPTLFLSLNYAISFGKFLSVEKRDPALLFLVWNAAVRVHLFLIPPPPKKKKKRKKKDNQTIGLSCSGTSNWRHYL